MNLLKVFSPRKRRTVRKTLADYKQELLMKHGREQFMKLQKFGLQMPGVSL